MTKRVNEEDSGHLRAGTRHLGGSIGVDGDHVLCPLLHFQLDVQLPLQGRDPVLVSRGATDCPRRMGVICGGQG